MWCDCIVALEKSVVHLSSENQRLAEKTEDLESRSRRCNLRVVGMPEKLEGGDSIKFMLDIFTEVLDPVIVPSPSMLDRAHRIGPPPPVSGDDNIRPRVFIVRFHNYRDKERILQRQSRDQLNFRGCKVFIFPDLSLSVAKKRAQFLNVKRKLHEKKVKFSLRFPAHLHVDHAGEKLQFDSHEDAQRWFDSHF
ncbi:hypothetical protein SKAU_G00137640 [Synaphobranchus kaupii]|uniref:L1 transposable element RRM domain-containing protein n=1 Tax=Synaphobranchus kaupii TaxID=118154 RepID=A0A9Q1FRU2_SYNKA|nr:hypothetical protein SKAU_G00137640 [Synaphobranchus kaupii]